VPILREWLQSDRADVRLSALETLGRIGPAAREAVPELIKLQKDRKLARWAQLALFHVAPDADPTIAETITLDDLWIGDDAESSVEVLGYALRHCQVTVRRYAADKLVEFGPAAEPATEQLTAATLDSDSRVRKSAARALMRLHVELDKTLPMLIGNLSNGNATTRQLAVFALGEIGGPAKSAMPQLTALLEHYDVGTREEAARSIAKIKTALAEHGESKADCP
jgi:HEAT repeat protein